MKKLSYYLSATASLALAVCMSISLSSCNKEDNPVNPDQGKGEAKLIIKEIHPFSLPFIQNRGHHSR